MRWGICLMVVGLTALPARASEAEARLFTRELRQYDRFATVLTYSSWLRRFRPQSSQPQDNVGYSLSNGIARIQIASFDPSLTCRDTRNAIQRAERESARAIELDLTDNTGGQRMMAVCVAGLFLGPRVILGTQDLVPTIPDLANLVDLLPSSPADLNVLWQASVTAQETKLPLFVKINAQTASAAELVAGVLQEYGRAQITGEKSFGKGRAQECLPMKNRPDLVLCYTVQAIFLPSGRALDDGVTPNDSRPD